MSYLVSSRGVGQYAGGAEAHRILGGRGSGPGSPGILNLQGSHSLADAFTKEFDVWVGGVVQLLCDAGRWVAGGDMSQTLTQGTFGNDTAVTRAGQLKTFIQAAPFLARAGKVAIMAGSGGATAAINYARANPALVSALLLFCPLTDLQDFHDLRVDATITAAEVETAYGGAAAYATALPTHSPVVGTNPNPLAPIPMRIYYSTNDPYIPVSTVTAFQAKVLASGGKCDIASLGPVGHSAQNMNVLDAANFLINNG